MPKTVKFSTGDKMPASDELLKGVPLVGEVSFSDFEVTKEVIKGKPIVCSNCGAILTNINNLKTDPKVGTYFDCQFCGSVIVIDPKDLPKDIGTGVEWLILGESKPSFGEGVQKGNALIAALDVSGSMSGAKLEGVKQSLISTIKAYSKDKENALFGIVTFESALRIYSPDGEIIEKMEGDILYDKKAIEKKVAGNSWVKNQLSKMIIKKTAKDWQKTVQKMVSLGSTALGPAVVAARIMCYAAGTGRILLLTDGMANLGIGSLSGASPEGKKFYQKIAEEMKNDGIVFDIVGIAGQASLELETLAQMPEITGGDLFYADLSELADSFSLIAGDEIIGRNARIKVIVPEEIELSNVSGVSASTTSIRRGEDITLGGLTKSRSVAFEFKPKKKIKERTVPVQVQIRYKDEEDNERIRVIEEELEVTELKEELEKSLDADLIAGYTVQRAAQVMRKDRQKGKKMMEEVKLGLSSIPAPGAAAAQEYLAEEIEGVDELIEKEEAGIAGLRDEMQSELFRLKKKRRK